MTRKTTASAAEAVAAPDSERSLQAQPSQLNVSSHGGLIEASDTDWPVLPGGESAECHAVLLRSCAVMAWRCREVHADVDGGFGFEVGGGRQGLGTGIGEAVGLCHLCPSTLVNHSLWLKRRGVRKRL